MAQTTERILTTHVGSLPRPKHLLDLMKAKLAGEPVEQERYESVVRRAVEECVARQVETGIDVVGDGEQSKPGFFTYVGQRLAGFEPRPGKKTGYFAAETKSFPEYYEDYFKQAMLGGTVAPFAPLVCTAPISYSDLAPLKQDIANLKAAVAASGARMAFMPATGLGYVGFNEFYKTEEEYLHALGAALRTEYKAIVDADLLLQIDEPYLCDILVDPSLDEKAKHRTAGVYLDVINDSLKGIPAEKVRFHTCYGINEGPRIHDAPMAQVANYMLEVNAGAYSFEAANARHEHEYHLWEQVKLPDGKKLIPGVITHASNIVEHPELIAERLVRFADLVGRDNVMAGADCGFSSQATYKTEVHPTVIWAKFEAMREGARLASERLWTSPAAANGSQSGA